MRVSDGDQYWAKEKEKTTARVLSVFRDASRTAATFINDQNGLQYIPD